MIKNVVPFRLKTNRMSYLIPGGDMIDRFLGETEGQNPFASQMWIASVVQTALGGQKDGCSYLTEEDGGCSFSDFLKENGEACLGQDFIKVYGHTPGFLLKLLNSKDRLLVQVHPDKEKAEKYFHLSFGKTEAWYILETEPDEKAYIWAGFRPGVTRESFQHLIEIQDTEGILNQLHRYEIHKGDVILIKAGTPHAMGNHSLVAEIQEPVDITLRAERFRPDGSQLSEESMHSGIGIENMINCFQFQCDDWETTKNRIFLNPEKKRAQNMEEQILIDSSKLSCFSMSEVKITGKCEKRNRQFVVALVLSGTGTLITEDGELELRKGTEFFVPNCCSTYEYQKQGTEEFRILECYPPVLVKSPNNFDFGE